MIAYRLEPRLPTTTIRITSNVSLVLAITFLACIIRVPAAEQNPFLFSNWFQNFQNYFSPNQFNPFYQTGSSPVLSQEASAFDDPFKIIWNVPSFQCHKYGLTFSQLPKWGLTQNVGDSFRGDKIALLYDPGLFPALLDAGVFSDYVHRNGGIPQDANLTEHLEIFEDQIESKLIPDKNFAGLAIIDFEHWRPIWNENFGSLSHYRKVSRQSEQRRHPFMTSNEIEKEASKRFEKAAWQFFRRTLKTARRLRPNALWGYYGFPLCFNYTPKNPQASCTNAVKENNERLKWLFDESSAVYPSLYYKRYGMNENTRAWFMEGRMSEATRVTSFSKSPSPVYPYTWLKYYDSKDFVSQTDLMNSFIVPKKEGAAGVIIWGASNDVNTEQKCRDLQEFVETTLGPTVQKILNTPKEEISTIQGSSNTIESQGPGIETGDNNSVDYVNKI